jgi:hypothetical protein
VRGGRGAGAGGIHHRLQRPDQAERQRRRRLRQHDRREGTARLQVLERVGERAHPISRGESERGQGRDGPGRGRDRQHEAAVLAGDRTRQPRISGADRVGRQAHLHAWRRRAVGLLEPAEHLRRRLRSGRGQRVHRRDEVVEGGEQPEVVLRLQLHELLGEVEHHGIVGLRPDRRVGADRQRQRELQFVRPCGAGVGREVVAGERHDCSCRRGSRCRQGAAGCPADTPGLHTPAARSPG